MKLFSLLGMAAWLAFGVLAAQADTVLFSDTFATSTQSDDGNFEYNAGRQAGALGNFQYRQRNGSVLAGSTIIGTIADEATAGYIATMAVPEHATIYALALGAALVWTVRRRCVSC
jgi:hypothetical protein